MNSDSNKILEFTVPFFVFGLKQSFYVPTELFKKISVCGRMKFKFKNYQNYFYCKESIQYTYTNEREVLINYKQITRVKYLSEGVAIMRIIITKNCRRMDKMKAIFALSR